MDKNFSAKRYDVKHQADLAAAAPERSHAVGPDAAVNEASAEAAPDRSLVAGLAAAKEAAVAMAALGSAAKDAALARVAAALLANKEAIAEANARDVSQAERDGLPPPLLKRLKMDAAKVEGAAAGIGSLIALPDPVGRELLATELDTGLVLRKLTCPIGVIGMIFESRPDALVQIAALCLKSGNAVIMKGGSEALRTNRLLTQIISAAACGTGEAGVDAGTGQPGDAGANRDAGKPGDAGGAHAAPPGWIMGLETRSQINEILRMDSYIDLLIPRGSNAFVRYIMDHTKIPVMGHADGICHCYVDKGADVGQAIKIAVDSKTQYVAVCNAAETLLVHAAAAPAFLPGLRDEMGRRGVVLKGCERTRGIACGFEPASDSDWDTEYLDYTLSVKIVGSLDDAIDHINRHGSHHTDAIVTSDVERAKRFMLLVDSANVFHNCSTRFSDGFRYGFGAEVGVSTGKIHARGPVGLDGLVTYKYLLFGHGDTVAEYEDGKKRFKHRDISAK
jgi:glutamate-5-semialdehyde dehydrogenase